jgi:hypothetical protein
MRELSFALSEIPHITPRSSVMKTFFTACYEFLDIGLVIHKVVLLPYVVPNNNYSVKQHNDNIPAAILLEICKK